MSESHKGKPNLKNKKPILQYDLDNNFIKEYDSAKSASIELNVDASCIIKTCKDKLKTTGGYK